VGTSLALLVCNGIELLLELIRGGTESSDGALVLWPSGLLVATSAFGDIACMILAYGLLELNWRASRPMLDDDVLCLSSTVMLAFCSDLESLVMLCFCFCFCLSCTSVTLVVSGAFDEEAISGGMMGHSSPEGLPASASTSVR
jgi:hypothetical protein